MKKIVFCFMCLFLLISCSNKNVSDVRKEMVTDATPVYSKLKEMMISGKVDSGYNGDSLFAAKYQKIENTTDSERDLRLSMSLLSLSVTNMRLYTLKGETEKVNKANSDFVQLSEKIEKLINLK